MNKDKARLPKTPSQGPKKEQTNVHVIT